MNPQTQVATEQSHPVIDGRVITIWRIGAALWLIALLVPALVASSLNLLLNPGLSAWVAAAAFLTCGTAGAWIGVGILPKLKYEHWSFRLGSDAVHIRNGILWHEHVVIPVSRLQHVDVHHGPLERRFDLASLVLHTAGTKHAAHTIPGLQSVKAGLIRDRLIHSIEIRSQVTDINRMTVDPESRANPDD